MTPATAVAWQRTPTAVGTGRTRVPSVRGAAVPVCCQATAVAGPFHYVEAHPRLID